MKVYDPDSNTGSMPYQSGVYAGRPDYYPLQPQKPIGVFSQYTMHDQEVTFMLQENRYSWSGDDMKIRNALGDVVFRVNGKTFSLHGRKSVCDPNGHEIFALSKRILAIFATHDAVDPHDGDKVYFTVKSKFSMLKANMSLTFNNTVGSGEPVEFKLHGDFFDRKAEITWHGVPVARISRQFFNARELIWDKQTYYLTVAPGVDAAMLVALCICLDEKEKSSDNR